MDLGGNCGEPCDSDSVEFHLHPRPSPYIRPTSSPIGGESSGDVLRTLGQNLVRQVRRLTDDLPRLGPPHIRLLDEEVGQGTGEYVPGLLPLVGSKERAIGGTANHGEFPAHAVFDPRFRVAVLASWRDLLATYPRIPRCSRP